MLRERATNHAFGVVDRASRAGIGADHQRPGHTQHATRNTLSPDSVRANIDRFRAFVIAMRECPKPVIAAVEGHAAGGGCSLVLACDLVVAAVGARFWQHDNAAEGLRGFFEKRAPRFG